MGNYTTAVINNGRYNMKITAYTYPGDFENIIYALEADCSLSADIKAEDFEITGNYAERFADKLSQGIKSVQVKDGVIRFEFDDFLYRRSNFVITGKGAASGFKVAKSDVTELRTKIADDFDRCEEDGILYRLYRPKAKECRPLVLYLHGGGENGFDNDLQLTGCIGAPAIAERYPDVYVMAPQAPARPGFDGGPPMPMNKQRFHVNLLSTNNNPYGWNRINLAAICGIIRRMIKDGLVDEKRVYVTGLSMGGGGTITSLSVGAGLFAAAVPICPTMTPDTFDILCGLTHQKLWVAAAFVDHTIYRHKYLVDAILKLRDAGNKNAKLTLFAPEELEAYGLGVDDSLPYEKKFEQYHNCAILVYHNEHGILDWLLEQVKEY